VDVVLDEAVPDAGAVLAVPFVGGFVAVAVPVERVEARLDDRNEVLNVGPDAGFCGSSPVRAAERAAPTAPHPVCPTTTSTSVLV